MNLDTTLTWLSGKGSQIIVLTVNTPAESALMMEINAGRWHIESTRARHKRLPR